VGRLGEHRRPERYSVHLIPVLVTLGCLTLFLLACMLASMVGWAFALLSNAPARIWAERSGSFLLATAVMAMAAQTFGGST
jgi:hypothetical protein